MQRHDMPPSWTDERLKREVPMVTTVIRLLALHGAVVLATKHPEMGADVKKILLEQLDHMEGVFKTYGLAEPPQGWRGDA